MTALWHDEVMIRHNELQILDVLVLSQLNSFALSLTELRSDRALQKGANLNHHQSTMKFPALAKFKKLLNGVAEKLDLLKHH